MNFDVRRIETKLLAVFLAIVMAAASVPLAALASDALVIEASAGTEEVLEPKDVDEVSEPALEEPASSEQTPEPADLGQEPAIELDEQLSEETPEESVNQQLIAEEDGDGAVSVGVVAVTPGGASDEADQGEALPEEHVASPLYVELYGDGFDSGDTVEIKIQMQKASGFEDVKLLNVGFGEGPTRVNGLYEGVYRIALIETPAGVQVDLSVAVGEGVKRDVSFDQGFAFDPALGATAYLCVSVAADREPSEEEAEAALAESEQDSTEPGKEESLSAELEQGFVTVRVSGAGSVVATSSDTGDVVEIASGLEATVYQQAGTYVRLAGSGSSDAQSVTVSKANEDGMKVFGADLAFEGSSFETDVTVVAGGVVVDVSFNEAPSAEAVEEKVSSLRSVMRYSMARSSGNESQPEVGDVFYGDAIMRGKNVVSSGGMVDAIYAEATSGILLEVGRMTAECADHSAASPYKNQEYTYKYTVTSVDKSTGVVSGTFYATAVNDSTDGVTRDGQGRLTGYQRVVKYGVTLKRTYQGYIDLQKASTCPDLVESSSLYSLGGAEYGIYSDSACTKLVETLVTDESGYAKSGVLDAGTYYVKETKAPDGHYLDENVYKTVVSGGTARVNGSKVVDEAINDPAAMWAFKKDAETGEAYPQGGASLAGAQFTVRYFDGFYDSVEAAEASGDPVRTWIVETDSDGYARVNSKYHVDGDSLYVIDGFATVPLGTILIQETKAPEGYLVNDETFLRIVDGDPIDGSVVYNAPEVPEQVVRGGISVSKTLEGGANEELEGIAFFILNSQGEKMTFEDADGLTTDRLVLDAKGQASTADDALVYDTYTIVEDESSVPDDIIWYGDAQGEGSAVVGEVFVSEPLVVYNVDVVNYKKPAFDLIKVDGDSLRDEGSEEKALKVSGSEWKLEYANGESWIEIGSYTTDENGKISFGEQALSRWGTYRLTEVAPAEVDSDDGYMWPEDSSDAEFVEFVIDENTWAKFEAGAYEGEAGDSWSYQMVDGKPALVHCSSNWRYRDIEVVKIDEETGDPVANTHFSLWRYVGEGEPAELGDARSEKHALYSEDPSAEIDAALWEKVSEGSTDDNGSYVFRGLTFGYYMTVEELPDPGYAYWWESEGSSWATYFFEVGELEQKQVQVYENLKITLETTVDKSTIERTSAAFVSLPDQNVSYDNVNIEEYRYDVGFTNGSTNVRADQYTVIDECEFTALGLRLSALTTPVVANDTDGSYNIWYRTNMTDSGVVYSSASATASNPENEMSDGTDRISTTGWKLWAGYLSTGSRQSLSVSDLGLAEGEYVTRLMLEFGSVEVGFETTSPLSYMVYSTRELSGDTVIPNTATSHITRNWNGGPEGDGLYDDASDKVETRVIDTLKFEPGKSTWTPTGWVIGQTGDEIGWIVFGIAASLILSAGAILLARRREKSK